MVYSKKHLNKKYTATLYIFLSIFLVCILFFLFKKAENVIPGTENWVTYTDTVCGIEFKHPEELQFIKENRFSGMRNCSVAANIPHEDYFIEISMKDKKTAYERMKSLEEYPDNKFLPARTAFQNGTFLQTDGFGTADYYFISGYYVGRSFGYSFTRSSPSYVKEEVDVFEKILKTMKLSL